ncbi:MAG TPA: hypothetical protein VN738_05105 [Acidothermaceae bacterium]|nr:hypothetical protein [Acidothermaceae bacterium]
MTTLAWLPEGHVVDVPSRAVRCSCCGEVTASAVFMGLSRDGARLPLWWCTDCKAIYGPTS